jgi:hypothetical protein
VKRIPTVLLVLTATIPGVVLGQPDPVFDGTWEGTIEVVDVHGTTHPGRVLPRGNPSSLPLRIEIRGSAVKVALGINTGPPVAGAYHIERHDAAAIVYGYTVSDSFSQTVQYSLTKTNGDELLVFVWRVSNDTDLRPDRDQSKWAYGGIGRLMRAPSRAQSKLE